MCRALFSIALIALGGHASACTPTESQQQMLTRVNEARSEARRCGEEAFDAARALTWSCTLTAAAQRHADEMATHDYFSHTGRDGSGISERATRQGYEWRTVGENIAAGHTTADAAIQSWIDSPGHCRNLMNDAFTDMGMAHADDSDSRYTHYWVQTLGALR